MLEAPQPQRSPQEASELGDASAPCKLDEDQSPGSIPGPAREDQSRGSVPDSIAGNEARASAEEQVDAHRRCRRKKVAREDTMTTEDSSGPSSPVTCTELQNELKSFAETVLQPQLLDLAARLQRDLVAELGRPSPERGSDRGTSGKEESGARLVLPVPSRKEEFREMSERRSRIFRTRTLEEGLEDTADAVEQSPRRRSDRRVSPGEHTRSNTFDTVLAAAVAPPRSMDRRGSAALLEMELAGDIGSTFSYKRVRSIIRRFVLSGSFERLCSLAIAVNALYIGFATEYMATHELEEAPLFLQAVELFFLCVFSLEMCLRLFVHKLWLFRFKLPTGDKNLNVYWNVLDCLVIGLQIFELMLQVFKFEVGVLSGISVIRLVRLLRLVRVIRVVKVLRAVADLRMIVYSIWKSLSLFFWAITALFLLNFMVSVYFTEYVLTRKLDGVVQNVQDLNQHFGTLFLTMLSLFKAVTGGIDWGDLADTLGDGEQQPFVIGPLCLYVAFTLFAMLNVVSGIFLDTAIEIAKEEKEVFIVGNARSVFDRLDHNQDGTITWEDFRKALDHPHVQNFFDSLRIHISEAQALFEILDMSGDGVVSADEFLNGCIRVRGPTKALDLLVLSREVSQLFETHGLGRPPSERESPADPSAPGGSTLARRGSSSSMRFGRRGSHEELSPNLDGRGCERVTPSRDLVGMFRLGSQLDASPAALSGDSGSAPHSAAAKSGGATPGRAPAKAQTFSGDASGRAPSKTNTFSGDALGPAPAKANTISGDAFEWSGGESAHDPAGAPGVVEPPNMLS